MDINDYNNYVEYSKEVLLKKASKYMLSRMYGIHDRNSVKLREFKEVYLLYKELINHTSIDQDNKINNIILNLKRVDYE